MRNSILVLVAMFTIPAFAVVFPDVSGTVTEVPSGQPGLFKFHITGGEGQAAEYTAPNLPELYERLKTEYPVMKDLIAKIYKDNGCDLDGTAEGPDDWYCGELNPLSDENTVLWSFGRGGWAGAGATRKSFLTWQSAGSGRFTDAVVEIQTDISANALEQVNENDPVVFEVTVDMRDVKEIVSTH